MVIIGVKVRSGKDKLPSVQYASRAVGRPADEPWAIAEESAKRLGVDPSTLAKWEQGKREPTGVFLVQVKRFLGGAEAALVPAAGRTA